MIEGVILDLDGTVYRGNAEIPGATEFILWLKEHGMKYVFVTNRANRGPEEVCAQLRGFGIPCTPSEVLTSAQATIRYLKSGTVWYIGEKGLRDELDRAGMKVTDNKPDYVIVSFDRDPTRAKIEKAAELIRKGAKFVATNPDKGLPTEKGLMAGTGAIVDSVLKLTDGIKPLVIGKPERFIIDIALEMLGLPSDKVVNVGDNLDTDIPAGKNAGVKTVFILTGISKREDLPRYKIQPDWTVENFEQLARILRPE